jgi:hypothetical protein
MLMLVCRRERTHQQSIHRIVPNHICSTSRELYLLPLSVMFIIIRPFLGMCGQRSHRARRLGFPDI